MGSLSRRTFAKLSAAVAATAVEPLLAGGRLAAGITPRAPHSPARPRDEGSGATEEGLRSEFLMDLTLATESPHQIGAVAGGRLVVPVSGGTFEGPRLKGTVITPGGDWILERPDGSRLLDVRILLQTDDAQTIYLSWQGIAYTPRAGSWLRASCPCSNPGRRGIRG